MTEGGGGGGPFVASLKPPVRILERNPLVVLHALKRSAAYLDQAPHVVGLQDGCNVIKFPNGASLLTLSSGALLHPRGVAQELSGAGTERSRGTVEAGDHLLEYRVREVDSDRSEQGLNALVRSRIWDIGFGPLGPAGALLAEALGGGARGREGPPRVPAGHDAARRGLVRALARDLRGTPSVSLSVVARDVFDETMTPQAVRLEFAARRLRALAERRVVLAGPSISPLDAWPRSVTSLADTWWAPYLRPAAMRAPPKDVVRRQRKLAAAAAAAGPGAQQALPGPGQDQVQEQWREQAEAEMQVQYEAQLAAQDLAEREARREAQQETKDWLKQAWLLSNVRSTLYYSLRSMDEEEDDIPLLHAGLNCIPSALPRDAPQDSFVAGYPDAVQEIYTQAPLELCAIPEGLAKPKPKVSAALQLRGPEGEKKRPTLTAQVTRIRGSAASAFGFTGLGADLGPTLMPLGRTVLDPLTGSDMEAPPNPASALTA